ncbi:DUF3240 family protein [Aquariibacter albus]|uniref:DUF3240 family protein n=1 Tax=Aquariibacter albus TaxID=2759899 RepID=A0A839HNN3_9BURK|nr:DUF3240 family protein [Aquariibacter albus]MBB1161040.1 DUF3240 family protein [Aquariibacter albus]
MSSHVCLHLLLPAAAGLRVTDLLLAEGAGGVEFSLHPVAARGPHIHLAADEERVQGHAQRQHLSLVLPREQATRLLARLQAELAGSDGGWWISPVEAVGGFKPAAEAAQ